MTTELYKIRSIGKCMKAAFDLLINNFKTILTITWAPMLMMSLVYAWYIGTTLNLHDITSMTMADHHPERTLLFLILFIGASIWLYTAIFSFLNHLPYQKTFKRIVATSLVMFFLYIAIVILLTIILFVSLHFMSPSVATQSVLPVVIALGLTMVVLLALTPLLYTIIKYLMEPEAKVNTFFGKPFVVGWHNFGYLLLLAIIVNIITSIISVVLMSPMFMALFAEAANVRSMQLGDPADLPSQFNWLLGISTFIGYLVCIFVIIWSTFVFYYAYGTIEAKEAAKHPDLPTETPTAEISSTEV